MKKVLLIGDSIREGYDKYVKEVLKDTAEVYYPNENCRFAQYILRSLEFWRDGLKLPEDLDVIHWNAGLWDTLRNFDDECLTPPDVYGSFIDRICKKMRRFFPKAEIIFATSTPVLEHKFTKDDYRLNRDVRQYNAIAVQVCKSHGFKINDLYAITENVPEEYYSDCTHLYTEAGARLHTAAVVKSVAESLGEDLTSIDLSFTYNDKQVIFGI